MTTVQHQRWLNWVDRYEAAWRAPGTEALAELFSSDAVYLVSPYGPAYTGLAEIAAMWEREREGPDEEFTLERAVVAVDGSTGVVRCAVQYTGVGREQDYLDLWVIDLDEQHRCTRYEEWPFWPEKGTTAPRDESGSEPEG
jgi:ketosteroid isomerase-like protein